MIDEDVTLKKLEVFLAFMKTGSMARVSESMSQSIVSVHRALHSLEDGLRCPLFKLDGRKLIPLQTAYTFAEYAERALRECEDGVRKTREVAGFASPRLKIGSLYSLTLNTIPQLLIKLKMRRPLLDIDLTLASNKVLLEQLKDGRVDAILIALQQENTDADLIGVTLFCDEIMFAAPLDSPYAKRDCIDLAETAAEKFVTLSDDFATGLSFSQMFALAGREPNHATRVPDIFSLINLVSGGVGYSLLPRRVEQFSPRLKLIPLEKRYAKQQLVTLLLPRKRERDPNLLALSAECRLLGKG